MQICSQIIIMVGNETSDYNSADWYMKCDDFEFAKYWRKPYS